MEQESIELLKEELKWARVRIAVLESEIQGWQQKNQEWSKAKAKQISGGSLELPQHRNSYWKLQAHQREQAELIRADKENPLQE